MQASDHEIGLYAAALVSLGQATGVAAQIEQDVDTALSLVERDERIRSFLGDPAVRHEGKRRALEEILAPRVHPVLANFLLLLADMGRLADLRAITEVYFAQLSDLRHKAAGEVVSARPLSPEVVAAVAAEVGRMLGKEVLLRSRVDPTLLGGLLVKVGNFVIDGTLDRRLNAIRQELLNATPTLQAASPG